MMYDMRKESHKTECVCVWHDGKHGSKEVPMCIKKVLNFFLEKLSHST